jgi:hypothetical protein
MKLIDRTKANTYKVASSGAELVEGNLYHFGYINEQRRVIGSRGVVYKRLNSDEVIIKTKSEISYADHFVDFGTVYGEEQEDNNLKEYLDIMIKNESEKTRFTLEAVIFEKARIKNIEDKIKRLRYKLSVQSNKKEFPQIKKQIEQLKSEI